MHPSPIFCALVAFWSVLGFYKSIFPILLALVLMECAWSLKFLTQMGDFGCGFVAFGCSAGLGNALLLIFVAFGLGLRVLQFRGFKRSIYNILKEGFCSNTVRNHAFSLKESRSLNKIKIGDHYKEEKDEFFRANDEFEEQEECVEDEVFSVTELRKMVKDQRRIANAAMKDLEKERMASASSTEEAMAMILRLQNDKSSLQIELNQLQRMREEKWAYDQEAIHSLQSMLMQCEDERSLLEQQLSLCKKRLRMYLQEDEIELLDCMSSPCSRTKMVGCRLDDLLVGCLD